MTDERLSALNSTAAIYWEVYSHVNDSRDINRSGLIDSALDSGQAAGLGGVEPKMREELHVRLWQRDIAMGLIGAIAFEMHCGENGEGAIGPVDQISGADRCRNFLQRVRRRFKSEAYVDIDGELINDSIKLTKDWMRLKHMNVGLKYLLFSGTGPEESTESASNTGEMIYFSDITTQAFFAAFWAARWAKKEEFEKTIDWLPDPLANQKEEHKEFWELLIEFRKIQSITGFTQAYDLPRWEEHFSPIYDSRLRDEKGRVIRCTNFICKTWDLMKDTSAQNEFLEEAVAIFAGEKGFRFKKTLTEIFYVDSETKTKRQLIRLCLGECGDTDNGNFVMGAPFNEGLDWDQDAKGLGRPDNPRHEVSLTNYFLSRRCVSNLQYELFDKRHFEFREFVDMVGEENLDNHPVVNITRDDAVSFLLFLQNVQPYENVMTYVLPTAAQWEYAARCGYQDPFTMDIGRNSIDSTFCNFRPSRWKRNTMHARTISLDGQGGSHKSIRPNKWGFLQMHGNVWEWCTDFYSPNYYYQYLDEIVCNPENLDDVAKLNVVRGGSWSSNKWACRSAARGTAEVSQRSNQVSLRIAAKITIDDP